MTLRPSQMPKVRRQTLRHLRDATSPIRSKMDAETQDGMDALTVGIAASELYWVQQDMAALAMHAGQELAAARWATADRPAPCGLLYWQDGIGHIDSYGVQIPVEACAWSPHGDDMLLWLLITRDRLVAETARIRNDLKIMTDGVPPLIPVYGSTLPVEAQPTSLADIDPELPQPIVAALAATWLLMQQPMLIDRTRERADKATARAYGRDGLPSPEVTIVDLRRQYTPQDRDADAGGDGRRYRHRWVVGGHWRSQAHGPGHSLRRQQWIPAHVKGPDGAPLLSTEKVNVWRR